jgi:multiple sugar transport system permease protein
MLSSSFKFDDQVFTVPLQWLPRPITFQNYFKVWTEIPFLKYYINTFIVTIFATAGQVFFSAMSAYAFAKMRFIGRDLLFLLFISAMMVPWHSIMVPQYMVMQNLRLIDTLRVLVLGQLASGFGIFLLRQFFKSTPEELREASIIDGAGEFTIFTRVILPLVKPGLAALSIFTFIQVWNDYLAPLIYLNSESRFTIQLGLKFFQTSYTMQYSVTMAGAVCATFPILIVYLVFEKYITKGIIFTGLKG